MAFDVDTSLGSRLRGCLEDMEAGIKDLTRGYAEVCEVMRKTGFKDLQDSADDFAEASEGQLTNMKETFAKLEEASEYYIKGDRIANGG